MINIANLGILIGRIAGPILIGILIYKAYKKSKNNKRNINNTK